jgi:hypothetical protein
LLSLGFLVAPFDWKLGGVPRNPVAVDAISRNRRKPQSCSPVDGSLAERRDDQVTYPLTVSLLGVPGVKTVRMQIHVRVLHDLRDLRGGTSRSKRRKTASSHA